MKEFAKSFYLSQAWKNTAKAYKASVGGLCEVCWSSGIVKAGEIVHHKIHLTPENINDPKIALDFSNLECVCRECHYKYHDRRKRRYKIDELGRVTAI